MRRSSFEWWKVVSSAVLIVAVVALVGGCERSDWDNPQYIKRQLEEGNPTEQKMALKKLEDLGKDKNAEVVAPALASIYKEGGANSRDAMSTLVEMKSKQAKDAYLQEVKTNEAGYSGPAAEALGQMQATDTIPQLLKLYANADSDQVKLAVLRGFVHMPRASMVKPLVETLRLSVDNNPIKLHRYSCEILGDIAQKNPGALNDDAQRALVRGVFLSSNKGQNTQRSCGLAVQQLGKPAIPILIETFEGKNKEVNELLRKYRTDSTQFPPNRAKVGSVQRLTSLRAEKAKGLYMESLEKEREVPTDLPDKFVRPWLTFEAQSIDEMILGLGDLGATEAQELLEKVLKGEYNEKWSGVMDYRSELQLRQDAAFALVRLGTRKSTDAMMKMALDGVIEGLEKRAAALEKMENREPMNPTHRYQFNWMAAKAFAHLGDGGDIERYKKLVAQTGKKLKEVRKKLKSFLPELELAKKCLNKGSDKAKAKCFGEAISADEQPVREKAAWELMRLPKKVAGPEITERLGTDFLGAREILTLGLYRNPHKPAIEKITEILEDESNKTADSYKLDHYRLKLLRAWLKNHFS